MKEERLATYFPNETQTDGSGCDSGSKSKSRQEKATNTSVSTTVLSGNAAPANGSKLQQQSREAEKTPNSTKTASESTEGAELLPSSTFQSRLWKVLYSNINRAVDEFYYLCEEEGNEEKCNEMIAMLDRTNCDFVKLIERMAEQRKFDMDPTHSTGVSWEVRKPTHSGTVRGVLSQQEIPRITKIKESEISDPTSSEPKVSTENSHATATSKLRAAAVPFQPSATATVSNVMPNVLARLDADVPSSITSRKEKKTDSTKSDDSHRSALSIEIQNDNTVSATPGQSPMSANGSDNSFNVARKSLVPKRVRQADKQQLAKLASSPSRSDEWDADTEAQVVLASERVWAEAEAWVEAEAAAEEAAWLKLREEANKENRSRSNRSNPSAANTKEKAYYPSPAGEWNISQQLTCDSGDENSPRLSKSISRLLLASPSVLQVSPSSHSLINTIREDGKFVLDSFKDCPTTPLQHPDMLERFTFNHSRASSGSKTSTPGQSGHSTPQTGNSVRSLHEKLSSPDRRRALSPTEAKRKHEARQIAAESNRDRSVNERIQKAMIASVRVKLRGEKEAKRLAQAEQALEDRLKDAEKRHGEHIKNIKGKAGNENAKVSEVMFINNINGAGIAEELQRRLEEAEARILAAGQRRQERLSSFLEKGKRKSSKKSQQMSALRLQLETKKMERWHNLQTRLDAVQQRREARIAEMKRRSDEEEALDAIEEGREQTGGHRQKSLTSDDQASSRSEPSKHGRAHVASNEEKGEVSTAIDLKMKKKLKKKGSKKLTAAELQEAQDAELLAQYIPSEAKASEAAPTAEISDPSKSTTDTPTAYEWVGPGGADDTGKVEVGAAYKMLLNQFVKRIAIQARMAAISEIIPRAEGVLHSEVPSLASSWSETGAPLSNILLSAVSSPSSVDWSNELRLLLVGLGVLPKEATESSTEDGDDAGKRKKKKGSRPLSKDSVVVEKDALGNVILTQVALKALGKLFAGVSREDGESINKFVTSGGIVLCRIYFGTEVGLLANPQQASTQIGSVTLTAACNAIAACCSTHEGRDQVFSTGLGALLADTAHLLLLHFENWWRAVRAQRNEAEKVIAVVDVAAAPPASLQETESRERADLVESQETVEAALGSMLPPPSADASKKAKLNSTTSASHTWIEVDASSLPVLLRTLDALARHAPSSSASATAAGHVKESMDAWLWYVFVSGLFASTSSAMQVLSGMGQSGILDHYFRSLSCRIPMFISGVASSLRISSGVSSNTILSGVAQLSSRKHSHPRGPQMVSLIRTSSMAEILIASLHSVLETSRPISSSAGISAAPSFAVLGTSAAITCALVALAALDVGLVQNLSSANQVCKRLSTRLLDFRPLLPIIASPLTPSFQSQTTLAYSIDFLLHSLPEPYWAAENAKLNIVGSNALALDPLHFSAEHAVSAINQILTLVGYVCVRNSFMQTLFAKPSKGEQGIPPLAFMCKFMPPNYYLHEHYRSQLLPTIAAMCTDSKDAMTVLKREIDCGLISTHLASLCRDLEDFKRESAGESVLQPKTNLVEVSARFPTEMWTHEFLK